MATRAHLNSPEIPANPAFSQGVAVDGPGRTIYVGGQNGIGPDGRVVGDDLRSQARQALRNVELVLAEAGAGLEDVVSWSILIVAGQPLDEGFAAFQEAWASRGPTPAISVAFVAGLARPDCHVEVVATAVTTP